MSVRFSRICAAGAAIALCQASLPAQENAAQRDRFRSDSPRAESSQQAQGQHTQGKQAHAQQTDLQTIIAKKLMMANKAEVELGKLALEKSQSEPVKKFAQMMVTEHQQLNEKLTAMTGGQAGSHSATSSSTSTSGDRRGQDAEGTNQANRDQLKGNQARTGATRDEQSTSATTVAHSQSADSGQQATLEQLMQLGKKAHDNELMMTKQMLQEYQGQDFDMGYLGQQIIAHTSMLAHLKACEQVGSQEFQQLISKAEQATQSHLEQAKQLAQRREDDRSQPGAAGARSGSSRNEAGNSRTQPGSQPAPGSPRTPATDQPSDASAPK